MRMTLGPWEFSLRHRNKQERRIAALKPSPPGTPTAVTCTCQTSWTLPGEIRTRDGQWHRSWCPKAQAEWDAVWDAAPYRKQGA